LKNGGQLKITTAHWKTAQGEMLDGKGITPDIVILPTAQDITENNDVQKEQALEHL
jgi:C-terminal processing protease CtpA/Prc